MRGEDLLESLGKIFHFETPPHARGRLVFLDLQREGLRNTPACAGKTCSRALARYSISKHPRMRGEDSTMTELLISAPETPPHARGRREDAHDIERAIRNTPACAGKTGCDGTRSTTHQGNTPACAGKTGRRLRLRRPRWKHPRMRGEDVIWRFRSSRSLETPPHARGRQLLNLKSLTQIRNTPACAGKTNRRHAKRRQGRKHPRMRGEDR